MFGFKMKTFNSYYTTHLEEFEPFDRRGFNSIVVCPELVGKNWDNVALGYIHCLRPSSIRVTKGGTKMDSRLWRVTVYINEDNLIREIRQEVEFGLCDDLECGADMSCAISYGTNSEEFKRNKEIQERGYIICDTKAMVKVKII